MKRNIGITEMKTIDHIAIVVDNIKESVAYAAISAHQELYNEPKIEGVAFHTAENEPKTCESYVLL